MNRSFDARKTSVDPKAVSSVFFRTSELSESGGGEVARVASNVRRNSGLEDQSGILAIEMSDTPARIPASRIIV